MVNKEHQRKPKAQILVRCEQSLAQRIDEALKRRKIPITRTYWMLEAIVEKLEREERKGGGK